MGQGLKICSNAVFYYSTIISKKNLSLYIYISISISISIVNLGCKELGI